MANYTNEKLAELAEFSIGIEQELARQFLAERQAAKAGVTDEVVENACAIQNEIIAHNIGSTAIRKKGMRAALASVWPTAGGVMTDPVLIVEYNAAVDAEIRDAKRWRCFVKGLRSRFAGAAHGKRIKIVEICPMHGDEGNSVDNIIEFVDAAIAAAEGEKK